jgi:hypothetical protein
MKKTVVVSIIAGLTVLGGVFLFSNVSIEAADADDRVYEMRTYITDEGRLDNLHARFRDHTNHLFVKHGIQLIGYWTPTDGDEAENTLIYIIAHDSREAAKKSWEAFVNDPEWKAAHAASVADAPIVNDVESVFMSATDYSPLR